MARVPTYDNLQTSVSPDGVPQYAGPLPGEIAARQMQQTGQALGEAGRAATNIALDVQQQLNQTRVNEAINRAREAAQALTFDPEGGFLTLKGKAALERPDGQALPEEYAGKLRKTLSELSGSLGNDAQRLMFQQHADSIANSLRTDAQRHMLGEWNTYSMSVQDGTIKLATDDAERQWSDPAKVGAGLQAAKAAVYEKGRLSGWSGAQTEAALLTTTSAVHSRVVTSALVNGNPTYALGYLNRYKAEMTADDILKVQGQVNQQVWTEQATQAVQAATVDLRPSIAPTGFDRLVQITMQSESGGRRYGADGKLLTSPAGAQGEMQVMPATARDPGMGVKPAQNDSPEELARVGRDYLQALLQKYGDPAKAWAAYNAGPGRLDKALQESARGRSGSVDWLSYMPAETQAYVRKNVAALAAGGAPVGPRPTEADFVAAALARLPAGATPQAQKLVREQAIQQFTLLDKSRKDQEDQAVAGAMRAVLSNGGRFSDLPAAVRAAIPPEKVDDVMNFAGRVFKGDDTTNPAVYQKLSNPAFLRRLSEDEFLMTRGELSEADFKHFAGQRQQIKADPNSPGNADGAAIKQAVDEHLRALRIDPSPKDDGGEDAARVGTIRKYVTDEVLRAQALTGKKFTDDEVRKKVGALFAQQGTVSRWFGGDKAAQMLTMKAGDIPGDVRDSLKADFAKQGISSPTDAQMLGAYWTIKTRLPSQKVSTR